MDDEEILVPPQYGRIGNTDDRLGRLENMLADLESFGGRSSGGFLRPDRSMMVKLTKTQTSLIKLHTDVNDLLLKVEEAPILGEDHLDIRNPSLPYRQLVKYMNLGRGTQVDGAYQPVSAESMSKDMVLPPVGQNLEIVHLLSAKSIFRGWVTWLQAIRNRCWR